METLINIVFNHEKAAIVPDFTFMQTAYCAYYFLRILSRLLLLVTHLTYCLSVTLQYEIMQDQNESVMCIYFILILIRPFQSHIMAAKAVAGTLKTSLGPNGKSSVLHVN